MGKKSAIKMPFVTMVVPGLYKTREMCDKVILEKGAILKFTLDCYENHEICDSALDSYAYA